MKKIIFLLLLINSLAAISAVKLFHIDRSKNKNQVWFYAYLEDNCTFAKNSKVEGKWLVLEKGSDVWEELSTFDKLAYGVIDQKLDNQTGEFKLKPLPEMQIKVSTEKNAKECLVKPTVEHQGKWFELKRVYVFSEEGFVMPTVKYIDIFFLDADGEESSFRINKD